MNGSASRPVSPSERSVQVSVILPCYRAAPLARRSVEQLRDPLNGTGRPWEIVVVDDGGADFAPTEWADDPRVRLIRLARNAGKGAAVRTGMLAASGQARIFTDVDLPFGAELVPDIARSLLRERVHVVIGDRRLPGSAYRLRIPWGRRAASSVFTAFVGTIVTSGVFDTQCGLKGVRGDVADALFPLLRVDRFAFDVELVYVSLKHRLELKRIPVRLQHNETSSVRLMRDSARGAIDVFRIKYNHLRRRYDSAALDELVRRDSAARVAGERVTADSRA